MIQAVPAHTTTALTVADIDTTVNCEPRILDTTLAGHLGMAQPRNIRAVIEANLAELATYEGIRTRGVQNQDGEVCTPAVQTDAGGVFTRRVKNPGRGRPGKAYYLTEGQALCICALSRAPNAPQVRRALIEAFMELRRRKIEASNKVPATIPAKPSRRKPVPAPVEPQPQLALPAPTTDPTPGPFQPGSDLLLDLKSAVFSAVLRVERGEATEFGQALLDVLGDRVRMAQGGEPKGVVMDWHWKRTRQAKAH